jgi:hypothetical protein
MIQHTTDFEMYSSTSKGAIQGYGYVYHASKFGCTVCATKCLDTDSSQRVPMELDCSDCMKLPHSPFTILLWLTVSFC